jgi:hypothetical protein
LAGIGPGGKPGHNVELPEEFANDLVGIAVTTQTVELTDDLHQRLLDVMNRAFGIKLALLIKTSLAFQKFFAVKVGDGMEYGLARRIGQEA